MNRNLGRTNSSNQWFALTSSGPATVFNPERIRPNDHALRNEWHFNHENFHPHVGLTPLGENKDGGGFQTVEESVGGDAFRENAKQAMLRLPLNYMFRTYSQGHDWGFLKIVQPDCSPVEIRVSFPNDIVWQRVVLTGRADITVGQGTARVDNRPPVQNTIPPIAVDITVVDIADQSQSYEPPLPGATITLRYDSNGQIYNAVTDGNGEARFEVPWPGLATVTVQKTGFRPYQWRANLIVRYTERQRIRLLEIKPAKHR